MPYLCGIFFNPLFVEAFNEARTIVSHEKGSYSLDFQGLIFFYHERR